MNRRSFLKTVGSTGITLMAGRYASARPLVLLSTTEPATISRIEWFLYRVGPSDPGREPQNRCAVRLTTTHGAQGWADMADWALPDRDLATLIEETLLGSDALDHEGLWRRLYEKDVPLGPLAAVDIALWDLHGRVENKPVHALLGTQRQQVGAYLTSRFNLGEPAAYAEFAVACRDRGLHGCKIHPYIEWTTDSSGVSKAGFPDKDMAAYQAVRDAVGDDYPCMADNYGTYTYDQALRVGRLLDDLGYAWYESPMPETDDWVDRYAALAAEVRTPVCAPETHPGSYTPRLAWITRQACDICRIDVHHGGFTACLQLAAACETAGIRLELHSVLPDAYPHLQLIGATSPALIAYTEVLSLAQDTHIAPGRTAPEPLFDAQGYVAIPQAPGMGIDLDWKYIATHRTA